MPVLTTDPKQKLKRVDCLPQFESWHFWVIFSVNNIITLIKLLHKFRNRMEA